MSDNKEILDIVEKTILVDDSTNWKPNAGLLMHVASYDDCGAHPDSIDEVVEQIISEGGKPRKLKLRIIIEVEPETIVSNCRF